MRALFAGALIVPVLAGTCACASEDASDFYARRCTNTELIAIPGADRFLDPGEASATPEQIRLTAVDDDRNLQVTTGDSVEDEFRLARLAGDVILFERAMVAVLPIELESGGWSAVYVVNREANCYNSFTVSQGAGAPAVVAGFRDLAETLSGEQGPGG